MIYAASILATQNETKEVEHHLFTFSMKNDAPESPEAAAGEIAAQRLLKPGVLYDCQMKIEPIDFSRHLEQYLDEDRENKDTHA